MLEEIDLSQLGIKNFHEDENQWSKIPQLKFGFQDMVENQGIYQLKHLKKYYSKEDYEFLKNIPQPDVLKMDEIQGYTPPSKDQKLKQFTIDNKCKYMMSTSTISSFLSQIFYSLSGFKPANYSTVPYHQTFEKKKYMNMQKKPSTNFFRCIDEKNDLWALDSDKGVFRQEHQILMDMGKILELQYTLKREQFQKLYLKSSTYKSTENDTYNDYHRLTIINNEICMRSQIDCWQQMKDGKKIVYEIKTRALAPVRYDIINYQDYLDYSLKNLMGSIYSYERENYDLIRGAILKYYFQLKIGGMDGAFIGYHNTRKNFGFEYIKRKEIENILFDDPFKGEAVFIIGSKIVNNILDYLKKFFKHFSYDFLKIGYYSNQKGITVFAETFKDEDYEKLQSLQLEKTDDMREINSYYEKFKPNPEVYKFDFHIQFAINGIINENLLQNLTPYDHINITYKPFCLGRATYEEYMHFLLHAYKTSNLIFDKEYQGRHIMYRDSIPDFT